MVVASGRDYTVEEYLALEAESDVRYQYCKGAIAPMTGGTPEHSKIAGALYAVLWYSLRDKPYSAFVAGQRLWVEAKDFYTYPDVMVVADPVELKPGCKNTVVSPVLIAEVLSGSTESYDRGCRFEAYRTIPAFQECLLVDQYRLHVEHFVRQSEHQWLFTEYSSFDAQVNLSSVGVEIALKDFYENVGVA